MNQGLDKQYQPLKQSDFKKEKELWAEGWKVRHKYQTHPYCYKSFNDFGSA